MAGGLHLIALYRRLDDPSPVWPRYPKWQEGRMFRMVGLKVRPTIIQNASDLLFRQFPFGSAGNCPGTAIPP